MTDYIDRLVARTLGLAPRITPRLASMFEPSARDVAAEQVTADQFVVAPQDSARQTIAARMTSHHEQDITPWAGTSAPVSAVHLEPTDRRLDPTPALIHRDFALGPDNTRDEAVSPQSHRATPPAIRQAAADSHDFVSSEPVLIKTHVPVIPARELPVFDAPPSRLHLAVETHERDTHPGPPRTRVEPTLQTHQFMTSVPVAAAATPAARRLTGDPEGPKPPTVRITIGRVDVRAVMPAPQTPRLSPERRPQLSLDDYLKRRSGEKP